MAVIGNLRARAIENIVDYARLAAVPTRYDAVKSTLQLRYDSLYDLHDHKCLMNLVQRRNINKSIDSDLDFLNMWENKRQLNIVGQMLLISMAASTHKTLSHTPVCACKRDRKFEELRRCGVTLYCPRCASAKAVQAKKAMKKIRSMLNPKKYDMSHVIFHNGHTTTMSTDWHPEDKARYYKFFNLVIEQLNGWVREGKIAGWTLGEEISMDTLLTRKVHQHTHVLIVTNKGEGLPDFSEIKQTYKWDVSFASNIYSDDHAVNWAGYVCKPLNIFDVYHDEWTEENAVALNKALTDLLKSTLIIGKDRRKRRAGGILHPNYKKHHCLEKDEDVTSDDAGSVSKRLDGRICKHSKPIQTRARCVRRSQSRCLAAKSDIAGKVALRSRSRRTENNRQPERISLRNSRRGTRGGYQHQAVTRQASTRFRKGYARKGTTPGAPIRPRTDLLYPTDRQSKPYIHDSS